MRQYDEDNYDKLQPVIIKTTNFGAKWSKLEVENFFSENYFKLIR